MRRENAGVAGGAQTLKEHGIPGRTVWAKPVGVLPEDPIIHAAAIAYTSDSGLIATVASAYGMWAPGGSTASLDHAIWFHRPFRMDDWMLYVAESPAACGARGFTRGAFYTRDGALVASVAQEGLVRLKRGS